MQTQPLFLAIAVAVAGTANAQEPELVQKGVISTDRNETFPTIDPVDGSLWFSVYDQNFDGQQLMRAPKQGNAFGAPKPVPFGAPSGDRAPRFSPDGKKLFFTSNRAVPGHPANDLNIWVSERTGTSWSAATLVPAPVSGQVRDMHNVVTSDGTQFLSSYRAGGQSRADIWRVPVGGPAEQVGAPISDALGQTDLFVSPDGLMMILVVTDPPGGLGGDDLFVSRFADGKWGTPVHLPAPINSFEYEYGPWVTADGRWLYFTSHRAGTGDIYRVPMERVSRASAAR